MLPQQYSAPLKAILLPVLGVFKKKCFLELNNVVLLTNNRQKHNE